MRAPAAVLSAAAERFAGLGHCKNLFCLGSAARPVAVCTVGAVRLEIFGSANGHGLNGGESPSKWDQHDIALCLLAERITGEEVDDDVEAFRIVATWNDAPSRTHADVLALLRGEA